jgi:hypothetical protein
MPLVFLPPSRVGSATASSLVNLLEGIVPRLKCGQGECVKEDTGNTVKSVQNDCGSKTAVNLVIE